MQLHIALATLVLTANWAASPDSPAQIERDLGHQYDLIHQAFRNKDIKAFSSFYGAGFTVRNPAGDITDRAAMLAGSSQQMQMLKITSWTVKFEKVTPDKSGATARTMRHTVGNMTAQGATHVLSVDAEVIDHWRKNNGHWQIMSSQAISLKATVDGKPLGGHMT